MSSRTQAWQEKWTKGEKIGSGGQGSAFHVTSRSDPSVRGVLKTLNRDNSKQARGRMQVEVNNLRVLHVQGLKVPGVIDHNTEEFNTEGVHLYFVMDFVEGRTLSKVIEVSGPLTLDAAAAVVADLAVTLDAAHRLNILHRDLKPDNVIVRAIDPADLVVVDFGLSFNEDEAGDKSLTQQGDQFRNRFLALPETNTPNGDRRDKRSDVSALSGILYFCLTGHNPGHLRDQHGKAPHRRANHGIATGSTRDARSDAVERLLDRGFSVEIQSRFQDCTEFTSRLEAAIRPVSVAISFDSLSKEFLEDMQQNDARRFTPSILRTDSPPKRPSGNSSIPALPSSWNG